MTTKARNWLIAIGILAFPFILFFAFLSSRITEPLPSPPPLPNQNGYDDFQRAAKMLAADIGDYDKKNAEQVKKIVSENAAALSLVRAGFSNECRVPVQYSESYVSNHLDDLARLKLIARAFIAEGNLAEMENHPSNAAKSYLDAIHFGNEAMRGGVLIDALVGIAIESIGTAALTNLVAQLDANSCHETAATLEALDSRRPAWNEIMQGENEWRKAFKQLGKIPDSKAQDKSMQNVDAACELKFNTQEQKTRQTMIDLAARAYELNKGKSPSSISDLVPDYLKTIPQDPLTGANMDLPK